MTVREWFEADKIFRQDVSDMAEESTYCEGASRFIGENWDTDCEDLTSRQLAWAGKILDDMVERRISKGQRRWS